MLPHIHLRSLLVVPFLRPSVRLCLASSISSAGITQLLASLCALYLHKVSVHSGRKGVIAALRGQLIDSSPVTGIEKNQQVGSFPTLQPNSQQSAALPLENLPCPKISFQLIFQGNCCQCEGVRLLAKGHLIHNLVKGGHLIREKFHFPVKRGQSCAALAFGINHADKKHQLQELAGQRYQPCNEQTGGMFGSGRTVWKI